MNILLSYTPQYFEPTQLTAITKGFILYDSIVFNLAVIANFTLIYIFFRNRTSSAATSHEKCICILLFCELCWAIPFAVQYPFMLSKGESFGFHACQWIGPVLPIWSAFTILAHALLALDRYHTILLENSMKRKQFILIGIIFIPPVLFVAVCPLLFGSGYVLNDQYYCFFNFKSRNGSDMIPIIIIFIYLFTLMTIIFYCYYNLYFVVANMKISNGVIKKNSTMDKLNRKIFFTCVTVLGCFTLSYTPVITSYFLQALFQYDFPYIINHFISTFAISDTLITPICLFTLIPSYRQGFKQHIYDYEWITKSIFKKNKSKIEDNITSGLQSAKNVNTFGS